MNMSTHGILTLNLKTVDSLHAAYMPFVDSGALFVPTSRQYELGDQVFVVVDLLDEPDRLPFTGTVVWISPANAQSGKPQGIGLRFNERDSPVRRKIESHMTSESASIRLPQIF